MRGLCACLLLLSPTIAAHADVTLVAAGQPAAVIKLEQKPTASAKLAAAELARYLRKMSGATLPVIRDPAPVPVGRAVILIRSGAVKPAEGSIVPTMAAEQIRVSVSPGRVLLEGCDSDPTGYALKGTLWAGYELLEKQGVRWLWPGELGEVVPQRHTITIPDSLALDYTPAIVKREVRCIGWNPDEQPGFDKVGITREAYEAHFKTGTNWWMHTRNARQGDFDYGHAFGNYWERFGKMHPEWFALQPDGSRDQSEGKPDRARLCVSNPELQAQIASEAIAKLKANPNLYCVSISPNDGGAQNFCSCSNCAAWDAPDGPLVDIHGTIKEPHVSLTDRYVKFYNAVADLVAKELRGRHLGAYAYSAYCTPPLHVTARSNVFIGYAGLEYFSEKQRHAALAAWTAWAKAAPGGLFFRPNLFDFGVGFPTVFTHRLGADIKYLASTGLKVTDFDTAVNHWAMCGLNYYLTVQLLWDPARSVDDIENDYCRAGFGPGASAIRHYFDTLEQMDDKLAASETYLGWWKYTPVLARQFTDEFLARLTGYLDEASTAAGSDEKIKKRVEFLRVGVDYARVNRDYLLAKDAVAKRRGNPQKAKQALAAATEAKLNYLRQLGITWALNPGYLSLYGM